ncbi:MAG: MFS transporter [Brevefilum sp.]
MQTENIAKPVQKWFILILGCLTNALVVAVPGISLSVLLPAITEELNLTLVQAGLAWGISSLPTILSFIIAGMVIDHHGPRRVLIIMSILAGLLGASRGLSSSFGLLLVTVALTGFFNPFINLSNIKNTSLWFPPKQMGLANGVISLGMALGFFAGSFISASFIAPWLGGWRNTFFFYGLISLLFSLPWLFSPKAPASEPSTQIPTIDQNPKNGLNHVAAIRNVWLLGLALFCFNGAVQGFLGYIPLYLRNLGWEAIRADSLAATFHLTSLTFTIPLTILSDRLKTRKGVAIGAASLTTLGILSFFLLRGGSLWGAVIAAGLARDGIMAILITMTVETKGVGHTYSGIATGFILVFASLGALISPPVGNQLSVLLPNLPFVFWGLLCAGAVLCLILLRISPLSGKVKSVAQ